MQTQIGKHSLAVISNTKGKQLIVDGFIVYTIHYGELIVSNTALCNAFDAAHLAVLETLKIIELGDKPSRAKPKNLPTW